ncbi:MAG: hypothetical protein IKZ53_01050 [Selenomonadaceae bacterium]|nr:hypothetical protein [Selenomonadaceae bacterium]
MRKKKVLVHGTAESMNNFFSDAVSNDYEVVALLSEENISSEIEILSPKNLPKVIYKLIDGIIITNAESNKKIVKYFLKQGIEPRKIILWDTQQGWGIINLSYKNGTQVIYFCGLEFHIRNEDDMKFFTMIHEWLQQQRQIKNLDTKFYPSVLVQQFQQRTGKPLDFNNLQTFTQKMQWIKIFGATPLKSHLADKYLVRYWIAEKIGAEYLIPLLGVWNDFDDINFDDLPNQFVLKCNHGWNMNIIIRDKKSLDLREAREKINGWLAVDFGAQPALEVHYSRIDRKIIAEKFMRNGDLPDIDNYKFWCFNGTPVFCGFDSGRTADGNISNLRIDYFDMNWKSNGFENADHPRSEHPEKIPKPKNFELMKELAATLAEGFAFVRVDFYEIEGKVYFGEMTFTPGAGNFSYKSEGTDEYLGSLLKLPEPTPPPKL